jgi:carbonic anhydrase
MDGFEYNVLQFHIHCPFEHTLMAFVIFACESDIVHQKKKDASGLNDLLVVGVLHALGQDNDPFNRLGLAHSAQANEHSTRVS